MYTELLARFALAQRRRGLRPNTIVQRDRFIRRFVGELDPYAATAGDIELWLDRQRGRGDTISSKSRSVYLSYLSAWFGFMLDQGLRADDPVRKIGRPRLSRRLPRPAALADLDRAVEQADAMMAAWLLLACYQGLRCCEIAGLRREDVLDERESPTLLVADQAKGGNERMMPLNPFVLAALREYGMPPSGPMFRNRDGVAFTPGAVSKRIARFLDRVQVSARAHRWRHTFGTEAFARTRDLYLVQHLMGHRDPATTALYVALNPAVEGVDVIRSFGVRGGLVDAGADDERGHDGDGGGATADE